MKGQERLWIAIGGADEALLARSERRSGGRAGVWLGWGAAACLALVLAVWGIQAAPWKTPVQEAPRDPVETPAQEDPVVLQPVPPPALPWPEEAGEAHYLRIHEEAEEEAARFSIYINRETYYSYEQAGVYVIRPRQEPEGTPACMLEIAYMADTGVDEALEQVRAGLAGLYEQVEVLSGPPNGWYEIDAAQDRFLFAGNGAEWDDAQREVWLRPDGEGGVFILSASYFVEAAEGHGARFADMMETFRPETAAGERDWTTALRETGERLAEAVFADDLDRAADLLAEGAEASGWGEDVSEWVSVASIDCAIPGGYTEIAAEAEVSVRFRLGAEEPYSRLVMEMTFTEGRWLAERVRVEALEGQMP